MGKGAIVALMLMPAALALAACQAPLRVVNSNSESVSVAYNGGEYYLEEVNRLASGECQHHGRVAVLRDMIDVDGGRIVNFDCRPITR